jgi:hypothetical protein
MPRRNTGAAGSHFEKPEVLRKLSRLLREGLRRSRCLLHHCRILLRRAIEMTDREIHFAQSGRLILRGIGNAPYDRIDFLHL